MHKRILKEIIDGIIGAAICAIVLVLFMVALVKYGHEL